MKDTLRLGYVGVTGDAEAWRSFAVNIYGMQPVEAGETLRLRVDERAWRFAIEQGDEPGLAYVGIELESPSALDAAMQRIKAAGFEATEDKALAVKRGVDRLVRTRAVDGTPLEIFAGALVVAEPFSSSTGARYVTGKGGLGHILILVPDLKSALEYYTNVLGFRYTDLVAVAEGVEAYFLHGGYRHHVIALASLPGKAGLDHVFVEVDNVTTVGRAWDRVMDGAAPVVRTIGQHANDPVISFYSMSPSGFAVEFGAHATVIDDEERWVFKRWDSIYLWGGHPGSAGHL